jgi:hypothetical protein
MDNIRSCWDCHEEAGGKRPKEWGFAARSTSTVVVKKHALHPAVKAYRALEKIEEQFQPTIDESVFIQMLGYITGEQTNEIAGHGVFDEESNQIIWIHKDEDAVESAGHVNSSSGPATVAALIAGHDPPNLQWHTHPGMGVFWSTTDERDQMELILDASKLTPAGCRYFLVLDQLKWRIDKIAWENGEPKSRQKGFVRVNDNLVLDYGQRRTYVRKKGKSYSHGGNWWSGKKKKAAPGITVSDEDLDEMAKEIAHIDTPPIWLDTPFADDADFMPWWEQLENDANNFMGSWSQDEESYRPLFEIADVEFGDWKALCRAIDKSIPGYAWLIIDDPGTWHQDIF